MVNFLLLMAGPSKVDFKTDEYPIFLREFAGKPLLQIHIEKLKELNGSALTIVVRQEDDRQFHLENMIKVINSSAKVIKLKNETMGSACSALLSLQEMNYNAPLVIVSIDELIDVNYVEILNYFESSNYDAGLVSFHAVHPRYSYIRFSDNKEIVEVSEKKTISNNAIAGFYYFRNVQIFQEAAFRMIAKSASVDGRFFIAPALNEIILKSGSIGCYQVDGKSYTPLKNEYHALEYSKKIGDF